MSDVPNPFNQPLQSAEPQSTQSPDSDSPGTGGGGGSGGSGPGNSGKKSTSTTPASEPTGTPALASGDNAVVEFFFDNGRYWAGDQVLQQNILDAEIQVHYAINSEVMDVGAWSPVSGQLCRYRQDGSDDGCYEISLPSITRRQDVDSGSTEGDNVLSFSLRAPSRTDPYFIKLDWHYRSELAPAERLSGLSTSRLFTQLRDAQSPEDALAAMEETYRDARYLDQSLWQDSTPVLPEEMERIFDDPGTNDEDVPEAGTGVLTPTTAATVLPSATDDSRVSIDDDGGSSSGSSGLSTGAIAGIGVGAGVVVLAIIGALIWFFCLRNRRRKSKDVKGPYSAPEGQASEFMVNKETNAHVTESPHSPYSDDGSLARAAEHHQQHHSAQPYSHDVQQPYSDAPPIAAPVPRSASQQAHASDRPVSRSGARSGTPAGNVSHLIEEGMTEDDIRRLEEEERALDDAIERAGHQRRS